MDEGINMGLLIAMIEQASGTDPEQIEQFVKNWLDAHPEATTTVQDGSITLAKLAADLAAKINSISSLSDEIDSIGSDVTDLKSAIDDVIAPGYTWSQKMASSPDVTVLDGFVRSPSQTYPGRIDSSTTRKCFYIQMTEDSFVYDVAGGSWSVVRISTNQPAIDADDETGLYWSSAYTAEAPLLVKAGDYVTITSNTGTPADILYISPVKYGLKSSVEMSPAMETQMKNELFTQKTLLDFGDWVNGYWANVGDLRTAATYKYLAACRTSIVFDREIILVSYQPYYIKGFVNGTAITRTTVLVIPKNATAYLYLAQINENTSITVDPDELAASVKVVNEFPYDEYNLFHDSFYGLGMFRSIGVCGDSYSAVRLGYSWGQVVEGELGITVSNFAKSGDYTHTWISDTAHGLPLLLSSPKCDLYWIALGINDADVVHDTPSYLGTSADVSGDDPTQYPNTFWGNMGQIIERIHAYAPNAKIVLFKPIFGSASTAMGITNVTNLPLIRTNIGLIAEHYNLPVMDALDDIFYRSPEYQNHMDYDISAGNHPSVMLYPGIAHANMRLFSRCVSVYDTYFMGIDYSS